MSANCTRQQDIKHIINFEWPNFKLLYSFTLSSALLMIFAFTEEIHNMMFRGNTQQENVVFKILGLIMASGVAHQKDGAEKKPKQNKTRQKKHRQIITKAEYFALLCFILLRFFSVPLFSGVNHLGCHTDSQHLYSSILNF